MRTSRLPLALFLIALLVVGFVVADRATNGFGLISPLPTSNTDLCSPECI